MFGLVRVWSRVFEGVLGVFGQRSWFVRGCSGTVLAIAKPQKKEDANFGNSYFGSPAASALSARS